MDREVRGDYEPHGNAKLKRELHSVIDVPGHNEFLVFVLFLDIAQVFFYPQVDVVREIDHIEDYQ